MPAYFTIDIVFDRNSITDHTVDELSFYLKHAALKFREVYGGREMTEKDMIARNQELLEKDFSLAPDQDKSEDYVQAIYDMFGFSGVRGFFINNFPENGEFTFELLIPEEEVLRKEAYTIRKEAADQILHLITNIWHMPSVLTIQTSTELRGETVSSAKFGEWKLPAANPYALVSEIQLKNIKTEGYDVRKFHVGGIILTSRKYMFD
jgi:hypothetical protein